ncbi:hypothetical protein B7P43_G08327 [Cryptotermes secundus]|uniref:Minor histocompatibility antigen H13 n=1 Tax=Cryptotermes secundus TaxID=105785 RepID=A0A2J7RMV4_9NEOP|nr:hypothetical protein B7P43_G08327 [Cryptotermes secundus]
MANIVKEVLVHNESLTEIVSNATSEIPATPEEMALTYGTFVIIASLAIYFGSFQSLKDHKDQEEKGERRKTNWGKRVVPLVGFLLFIMIFFEEIFKSILTGWYHFLGILTLYRLMRPVMSSLITAAIQNIPFHRHFTQGGRDGDVDLLNFRFWTTEVVCLVCCFIAGAWYLIEKHWFARTFLGIAVAMSDVHPLFENNLVTSCILPCLFFVVKILLVTAATSFDGPIKLFFPQDHIAERALVRNVVTFGYCEIVHPGRFIAMMLRFDNSLKRNSNTYFNVAFAAYFVGLTANIFVTHVFKYTLPPLLYLVPACVGTPMLWALLKGDIKAMFQ